MAFNLPSTAKNNSDVLDFHETREKMLVSRGQKYRSFLRGMDAVVMASKMLLTHGKARGEFLRSYYGLMRYLDDLVDGDQPMPEGHSSAELLLDNVLEWLNEPKTETANHPVKQALLRCFAQGKVFGQDFTEETRSILSSLRFDAQRKSKPKFYAEADLQEYFFNRDINGTVRGCLKICGEDVEHDKHISALGNASRIYYNLRDFDDDVKAGFINISAEDAKRLGITLEDCSDEKHPAIQRWKEEQVAIGMDLLAKHVKAMSYLSTHPVTKIVLHIGYARPAQHFFQSRLSQEGLNLEPAARTIVRHPIRNAATALQARLIGRKHEQELGIASEERERYNKKIRNLALCYSGLTNEPGPAAVQGAVQAGFLSFAYDVITDWQSFDDAAFGTFVNLLRKYAPPDAEKLAVDLYHKDKQNQLENDGLERGSVSLKFIAILMGVRQELADRGIELTEAGELLQIVDDILDYEEDIAEGQLNCLATPRANLHIRRFLDSDLFHQFDQKTILGQTIMRARLKAHVLTHHIS